MANYKVKHYWKDGASSVWEADKNLNKEIFEYLKKNYHSFVEKRPKSLLYKEHTISFKYIDGKDSFGREITDVTFYISNSKKVNKNIIIYLFIFLILTLILIKNFMPNNNKNSNKIDTNLKNFISRWNKNPEISNCYLKETNKIDIVKKLNSCLKPLNNGVIEPNLPVINFENRINEIRRRNK